MRPLQIAPNVFLLLLCDPLKRAARAPQPSPGWSRRPPRRHLTLNSSAFPPSGDDLSVFRIRFTSVWYQSRVRIGLLIRSILGIRHRCHHHRSTSSSSPSRRRCLVATMPCRHRITETPRPHRHHHLTVTIADIIDFLLVIHTPHRTLEEFFRENF